MVVCAAGSMPGDLHKLWRTRDPKQFHLEYGYSCMGYEIPGAIGIRLADPGREVFAMVGDAGYLMNPGELVTAVAEGIKIIVVVVQNHGYASIGSLSEASGNGRFGTRFRYREADGTDGEVLPVDLAANAASLGAKVLAPRSIGELADALKEARASDAAHRRPRRDRPGRVRDDRRRLVGRCRGRGLRLRVRAAGPGRLRGRQGRPAALPVAPNLAEGLPMRTINHWINGQTVGHVGRAYRRRLRPGHRAAGPQVAFATGDEVDAAVRPPRPPSRPGATPRSSSGPGSCSPSATCSSGTATSSPG